MKNITVLIETLRHQLNQHQNVNAILYSEEVLNLSRQLDVLIVKYQHEIMLQRKERRKSA